MKSCMCLFLFQFWLLDVVLVLIIGPTLIGPLIPLYIGGNPCYIDGIRQTCILEAGISTTKAYIRQHFVMKRLQLLC